MFKSKYIICTTLFVTFLTITSLIKNKSRLLEKQITNLNTKIISKEKDINEAQLGVGYSAIGSGFTIGVNNYRPISYSRIFLQISDFSLSQNKFSHLNNFNEKKIQKK